MQFAPVRPRHDLPSASQLLHYGRLTAMGIHTQALVSHHGKQVDAESLKAAMTEAVPLITDADLIVTALSLQLAESILKHQPAAAAAVSNEVGCSLLHCCPSSLMRHRVLVEPVTPQSLHIRTAGTHLMPSTQEYARGCLDVTKAPSHCSK